MKKEVNYTAEQTASMVEAYVANPTKQTVVDLAEQMGKTEKSVVAKLAREGVYQKPVRTTKAGAQVVRKEALVRVISHLVGFQVNSLEKATKQDLIRVANALARNQDQAVA